MGLININSLSKHIDELKILMSHDCFDILAINETKLDSHDSNFLLTIPGFKLERRDRNKHGGGVCFYIRSSINYTRKKNLECNELELIALEIKNPNSSPFLVATWYRPPKLPY